MRFKAEIDTSSHCTYAWQPGDTELASLYFVQVQATNGAQRVTFPDDGYGDFEIKPGLVDM